MASFAIGNEPDWHAFHTYPGHRRDLAIYEEVEGVPGSAYRSYLAQWRIRRRGRRRGAGGAVVWT